MSLKRAVPFRSEGRVLRRIAAGVAAIVLALSLATPVQAAPAGPDGSVLSPVWTALQSWLEGLLGVSPAAPAEEGPVRLIAPESCEMDPNGSTCESAESDSSAPPEPGDRPDLTSG